MKLIKTVLLISALAVAAIANAQTCNKSIAPTTPDSRFTDNGDGTVTDKSTNLIWMRCALGQTWNEQGQTCVDEALEYTWQPALQAANGYTFADSSAWRLPSVKELKSIVERACYSPAINLNIFPQTPSESFWSSSPYADNNDVAWVVYFNVGHASYYGNKNDSRYVRLVHSDSN